MNSNIISFLVGALLSGLIFYFLPEGKYDQEFERVKLENDSLQLEMNYFIDSILVENEELREKGNKVDTIKERIVIRLNNDINQVYSINDSDSLVELIKRSIHNQGTSIN